MVNQLRSLKNKFHKLSFGEKIILGIDFVVLLTYFVVSFQMNGFWGWTPLLVYGLVVGNLLLFLKSN